VFDLEMISSNQTGHPAKQKTCPMVKYFPSLCQTRLHLDTSCAIQYSIHKPVNLRSSPEVRLLQPSTKTGTGFSLPSTYDLRCIRSPIDKVNLASSSRNGRGSPLWSNEDTSMVHWFAQFDENVVPYRPRGERLDASD